MSSKFTGGHSCHRLPTVAFGMKNEIFSLDTGIYGDCMDGEKEGMFFYLFGKIQVEFLLIFIKMGRK